MVGYDRAGSGKLYLLVRPSSGGLDAVRSLVGPDRRPLHFWHLNRLRSDFNATVAYRGVVLSVQDRPQNQWQHLRGGRSGSLFLTLTARYLFSTPHPAR